MEPIHSMSSLVPLPEFDLWAIPPTQVMVEEMIEAEYRPITAFHKDSPIVFNISTSADEYIKLDDIYFSCNLQVKITRNDKALPSAEDFKNYMLSPYVLHSMIDQVDIEINNKKISNLPQNYPYRAFVEALLGFSKDAKNSHLKAAIYSDTPTPLKQIKDTENSVEYNLMGKLHHDLGFQGKYLIGGCNVKIEIFLKSKEFWMIIPDTAYSNFDLKNIKLFVRRAKINPALLEAHRKALEISPVKYPISRTEVKHVIVPSGLQDVWVDNLIYGQIPRRMFVFMVDNDAFNGNETKNPFEFKHFKCDFMSAYIDGVANPAIAYTPNFTEDNYSREYLALYQALNQDGTDTFCNITMEEFKANRCIFGFNFAPDKSNGCGMIGHANPIKKGTLRLQLKFQEALKNPITICAFCEFDNIIEINNIGEIYLT